MRRDLLFSRDQATRQGVMLTHLQRWYEKVDILRMATSVNGELLSLSGPRNPYPGKLGVVEEDALADLHRCQRRSDRRHRASRKTPH